MNHALWLAGATIAFDLDGTLADTAPDIANALNQALAEYGAPSLDVATVRAMIGGGVRALIDRASARLALSLQGEQLDQLTGKFVEAYRAGLAEETIVFVGAAETLATLRSAGAALCVCTNKRTDLARALLDALALSRFFTAVVGPDIANATKPDPQHYYAAIAAAGGSTARSLMVGDSRTDLQVARAAGAPCAIVAFGYEPEAAREADHTLTRFQDLILVCQRTLGGGSP